MSNRNINSGTKATLLPALIKSTQKRYAAGALSSEPTTCIRLADDDVNGIIVDQFGDCIWIYWYSEAAPSSAELADLGAFAQKRDRKWMLRLMTDRGKDPNTRLSWSSEGFPEAWVASEDSLKFMLRSNSGLSPGLFLDQRYNRQRIRQLSANLSVLNLFSYTGGFTVAALAGGARHVTSVDASRKYLEWSTLNIRENGLDVDRSRIIVEDCRRFVRRAKQRGDQYDLIVCDPPTFSRTAKGVFRVAADLPDLVSDLNHILSKKGGILFCSSNEDVWPANRFRKELVSRLSSAEYSVMPDTETPPGFSELTFHRRLKTIWVERR
jgi:23S rRNA (cytosine1962-C5)-methyltransferase